MGNQRKFCSNACKQRNHYQRVKSQTNTYHSQTVRGLRRKLMFVLLSGGRCERCGYDKNISSLEFHHLRDKEFQLDMRTLSNSSLEILYKEYEKCMLLCANCHRELHNSDASIDSVLRLVGDSLEKSSDAKWMNSKKPLELATLSQALRALREGAETSG